MHPYYTIEKRVSETPLQALARLRERERLAADIPLAYAGRLDPMASGTLLVLAGEECKRQYEYHGLDKEYQFEILFGCTSDTGDILGIPSYAVPNTIPDTKLADIATELEGAISLPYPVFSSRTVKGKPLFLWTLEKRLNEIEIPIAHTHIYRLRYTGSRTIPASEVREYIHTRINALPSVTEPSKKLGEDFRRGSILPEWDRLLTHITDLQVASFTAVVTSGTYIRALAPHIAILAGTTGLAYAIHRTRIGRYMRLPLVHGIWTKTYA